MESFCHCNMNFCHKRTTANKACVTCSQPRFPSFLDDDYIIGTYLVNKNKTLFPIRVSTHKLIAGDDGASVLAQSHHRG